MKKSEWVEVANKTADRYEEWVGMEDQSMVGCFRNVYAETFLCHYCRLAGWAANMRLKETCPKCPMGPETSGCLHFPTSRALVNLHALKVAIPPAFLRLALHSRIYFHRALAKQIELLPDEAVERGDFSGLVFPEEKISNEKG